MSGKTTKAILHPTDFSEQSDIAFAHALRFALESRATLYILHVHAGGKDDVPWHEYPSVRATLERWGLLEQGSSRAAVGKLGIDVEKLFASNTDVVKSIVGFRMRKNVDLMVLGTGRRGRLALGSSTAERMALAARVPTLIVPSGARPVVDWHDGGVSLRRVLVPVARKPRAGVALARAQELLALFGSKDSVLTALHVGDERDFPLVDLPEDGACQMERVTESGNPTQRILERARATDADLILMATAGPRGMLGGLLGSTTQKVLRRAPCPVLVLPTLGG